MIELDEAVRASVGIFIFMSVLAGLVMCGWTLSLIEVVLCYWRMKP